MSIFSRKKEDKTGAKRLSKSKKKHGLFTRRKNQVKSPDGLGNITTPNVNDAEQPAPPEQDQKETTLTKQEQMEKNVGAKYTYLGDIGQGAFGKVVKVTMNSENNPEKFYAVKIVGNIFKSISKSKRFLREIRILRLLSAHECVVELVDLVPPLHPLTFDKLSIVFEYMPTDLKKILRSKQYFSNLHIEYILYQILLGISYVHSAGIVHRDLKPENIIINEACTIRLVDFGLARSTAENLETKQDEIHPESAEILTSLDEKENTDATADDDKNKAKSPGLKKNALTKHVVTRWYRAPEVILLQQERETIFAIDIWSIGCIFAELLQMHNKNCSDYTSRVILFPGHSCFPFSLKDSFDYQRRTDQLRIVFGVIGTPTSDEIEKFKDKNVRTYLKSISKTKPQDMSKKFPAVKKSGLEILSKMLQFDVSKRITAEEALKSDYFKDVRDDGAEQRFVSPEKFEFEDIEIPLKKMRALILDEILYFNPDWKKQLKQEYKDKKQNLKKTKKTSKK